MKLFCAAPDAFGERHPHVSRTFVTALVWLICITVTRAGHAADVLAESTATATTESTTAEASSEIYVIGTMEEFEGLREVIGRDRIGPVTVRWFQLERFAPETVLSASGTTELKIRCWIDLSVPDKVSLYFADRSSERFLVREVPLSKRLTEIEKETLAQVVEMSVAALIHDATLGISRANVQAILYSRAPKVPTKPSVVPPSHPFTEPNIRLHRILGTYYQLESHSPQLPWVHTPGAMIGIARKNPSTKLSLALRVGYQLPEEYRSDLAGLRLSALRLRTNLALDVALDGSDVHDLGNAPYFGVVLGAGATLLFVDPLVGSVPDRAQIAPKSTLWVPTLSVGCRATQPFGGWAVALGFQAEVELTPVSYDARLNNDRVAVVRSHSVRPSVVVEVGWL